MCRLPTWHKLTQPWSKSRTLFYHSSDASSTTKYNPSVLDKPLMHVTPLAAEPRVSAPSTKGKSQGWAEAVAPNLSGQWRQASGWCPHHSASLGHSSLPPWAGHALTYRAVWAATDARLGSKREGGGCLAEERDTLGGTWHWQQGCEQVTGPEWGAWRWSCVSGWVLTPLKWPYKSRCHWKASQRERILARAVVQKFQHIKKGGIAKS